MEPYTSTIHIGRSGSTLTIGKKGVVRGRDAEPTILFDFRENVTCLDVSKDEAQAIVDALTAAIATIAVPDIELHFTSDFDDTSEPLSTIVTLDGERLRLVNWVDFRGWEVRRAESYAPSLGYLSTLLEANGDGSNSYTVSNDNWERGGFRRIDEALRALVRNAS